MQHTDKLGRRNRIHPQSTEKTIRLTERYLMWFSKLAEHGPLPSSFLLAFAKGKFQSKKRATERLTDLFNETNTAYNGAFLKRPLQQFRTLDSRYNQLVYDLEPAAIAALQIERPEASKPTKHAGPWVHQLMVSCATASVDLGRQTERNVRYIAQSFLLSRAGCDLRYTFKTSTLKGISNKTLIPDAVFGLEYATEKGARYRCFAVEADRSTEPGTSRNTNRKSWQRTLQQYNAYIGKRYYQTHLNLKAPLLLLIIVPDQKRAQQILRLIPRFAPDIERQVLIQTWESFGVAFKPQNQITIC